MLILASNSPARKALLTGAGLRFETSPAQIDERALEAELVGKPPELVARQLAEAKAVEVSGRRPDAVVIGGDQMLAFQGELLHKPDDLAAARRQLDRLRGRLHHLHCGVAVARDGELLWSEAHSARLLMRDFSDAERDEVLALEGEAALRSVGAYRLEGPSVRLFAAIEGDYFTILGLPLLPLLAALRRFCPKLLSQ
ncbi:MAG: Maf family protein [Devosia sp.]